jgi:hypothetical protein
MATKPDPIEEVHFRVDEHERALQEIRKIGDSIPALVDGGVAALHASMKAELAQILAGQAADVASDKEVAQSNREVAETNKALAKQMQDLCARIDTLVRALCTPTKRTAVLELPSGPATMTVRESREH